METCNRMKKFTFLLLMLPLAVSAQYSSLVKAIERLEQRRGILEAPITADLSQKKFVSIQENGNRIDRHTLVLSGQSATLAQVVETKGAPELESHVYQGDFIKTRKNVLSLRFSVLDGKALGLPLTKTLMVSQQDHMLYLFDPITKERWLDTEAINNQPKKNKKK